MKKVLSIVLSICMLLSLTAGLDFSAFAMNKSGKCGDNVTYKFNSSTGLLTISGTGDMYDYSYDDEDDEFTSPFDKNVKSVVINDGVTSIGSFVFYNCYRLMSITIPNSVTSIAENDFEYTAYYNNEANWENNVLFIGNHLIKAKSDISGAYSIKDGTKTIADSAFEWCGSLTSIEIPNSVTSIGDDAFSQCISLTSINIPDSVTRIGCSAFYNTAYYNNDANWENNVLYIGNHFIKAKSELSGDYSIKDGTKTIAGYAFYCCSNLNSINIPDSVINMGYMSFYNCTSLTSIKIPNSITRIEDNQFNSCISLTNVVIPDSVTSIGYRAFSECSGLTSIGIPGSVKTIDVYTFYRCSALKSVVIENGVTSIGDSAFQDCTKLIRVEIPDKVNSIGNMAFSGCGSLTDVYYTGSKTNWKKISIKNGNKCLTKATIHYNSEMPGKKVNTLTVKAKTATVKYSKLKKKNQSVAVKNVLTVSKAQGAVSYEKKSGNKKITINKKTGKVTVKKGLKKGTYKIKVKVSAAGNSTYKSGSKTVTFKIKVK